MYEAMRMFGDRLVDAASKTVFEQIVKGCIQQAFKYEQKKDDSGIKLFTSLTAEGIITCFWNFKHTVIE